MVTTGSVLGAIVAVLGVAALLAPCWFLARLWARYCRLEREHAADLAAERELRARVSRHTTGL